MTAHQPILSHSDAKKEYGLRVYRLGRKLNNVDSLAQEDAVDRLTRGQAAYWSVARYHDSHGCIMRQLVNTHRGIEAAFAEYHRSYPHSTMSEIAELDKLLPLNAAAVHELLAAYKRAGTFRTEGELIARTAKAEG